MGIHTPLFLKGDNTVNFIDNLIGYFNPEAGARRCAYRGLMEELREERNYDAGMGSRFNSGWKAQNQSAEMTDRIDRDIIRARARDLERNSDIANSVLLAFRRNVIGAGFTVRPKTGDEELNGIIREEWERWCKARNCDVTERQSFSAMMRMAEQRKRVDGGMLIRKCYIKGARIPFKLQALEVDELDATATGPPRNKDNKIVNGIEYNLYNRIEGYWIKQYDIDGWSINQPKYVDAKDMIFIFDKNRPSQIREMSNMASAMPRIRDANEFMTAVSIKQRIEACLAVFVKKYLPQKTGRVQTGPEGTYKNKKLSPGMIMELNPGDDVQSINPSGQSADAASMIKLHQRMIGAGQGVSYEATSRDMSQSNYSSARQGMIEDGLTFVEDKELILETLFDEIYETFIISAWLAGVLDIKDFWENKETYLAHMWVEKPKPWIDPLKEANANRIALEKGIKTYQQIAAENGRDWKEQLNEMAEVIEHGKEKGIDMEGILYGKSGKKA